VALVTGASRGLGEGAARALAEAGAAVILVARNGGLAGKVAGDIAAKGARVEGLACDVSDYAAIQRLVGDIKARLGGIEILVNNAGVIEPIAEVATSDPAVWADNISINLVGAFHVLRAVLPDMLAAGGGTIVNVSSGAAHRPLEGWSAYCAGKAGLAMLTRSVALETAGKGIRIFGFSPGTIDTDSLRHQPDQPHSACRAVAGGTCGTRADVPLHAGERRPRGPGRLHARRCLPQAHRLMTR